ncbi:MAG: hypothetical protein MZV49_27570 [Rhodopseudomonas palustris]|nr:hypothetical protein [Rhodopseudomonas palustris]
MDAFVVRDQHSQELWIKTPTLTGLVLEQEYFGFIEHTRKNSAGTKRGFPFLHPGPGRKTHQPHQCPPLRLLGENS